MRGLTRSLASDGITVVVSRHLLSEIEQVCDYIVMIRGGRLVHQGPAAELNRLAARIRITLRRISERTRSLEDVFFQLTGADAAVAPGQEMGAI